MTSTITPGKRFAVLLAAASLLVGLAACDSAPKTPAFQSVDITGSNFGSNFRLTDHTGKPRTLADFRGKVVVLFFGYTNCPDVCPTTLSDLAAAMKKLGKDAERVQVLFVTLDPERDTPALLSMYVPSFNPSFLGLYGDLEETTRVAKEFKVFYEKRPGNAPNNYTMDHFAGSYIFDSAGRLRLFVSYGQSADVFAHDIKALLNGSTS
ncbi:MAG: SCO family protein [Betaproteobacteria bacterium]|nr:SCO family protein [Betaproteobacteria bacterium]